MSAQALANRCEELGYGVPRSVITNLENGRRDTVTVAELLIFGAALSIPPLLLLYPVGELDAQDVLPDRELAPIVGFDWASGGAPLPDQDMNAFHEAARVIWLFGNHRINVEQLVDARLNPPEASDAAKLAEHARLVSNHENALRATRSQIRSAGLTPPPLPSELSRLADEEARERAAETFSPRAPRRTT